MNIVSFNIKKIRESRNLTQEYVASKLGISQNAYSRLENNRTRLTTDRMRSIAGILEVSLFDLFRGDDPAPMNRSAVETEAEKNNLHQVIGLLKEEIEHLRKENLQLVGLLEKKLSDSHALP